ncbi:hypothetical protein BY996DRAFT_842850 [Phakopsora pachyrhizi]|nr:hypothetical protein BY996DRAFT_842850 [Phakopsora pachyrhizi]
MSLYLFYQLLLAVYKYGYQILYLIFTVLLSKNYNHKKLILFQSTLLISKLFTPSALSDFYSQTSLLRHIFHTSVVFYVGVIGISQQLRRIKKILGLFEKVHRDTNVRIKNC